MVGAGRLTSLSASLLEQVRGHFPPVPLAVALSGGADSAVCAWAASRIGSQVRAITVDHRLPASAALVAAAESVAAGLGLAHSVVTADQADTTEAGLRAARYSAIEAIAAPGEALVSGHTADDQAETVLGNLLRGAGATGLSGIPRLRGKWHRPLLQVSRETTRAAAIELGLPFSDDPGNTDLSIRRSRIRTEVIPYLEQLNPLVRDALVRTARLAADDEAALQARAGRVPLVALGGEVRIAAAALTAVPSAVASRAVRRGLRVMMHPYPGALEDVATVLSAAAGGPGGSISTGLIAVREGPWVTIHRGDSLEPPAPAVIRVGGTARFGEWTIEAEQVDTAPLPALSRRVIALAGAGGELSVRAADPGDVISMGEGSKSVRETLREAGVPKRLRSMWPVVEQGGRMVWVVGCRHAAGVVAAPGSPATVLRAKEGT